MPRFSLRQKLWAPLVVCWVALLFLTVFNAWESRVKAYSAREQALADVVEMAETLLVNAGADVGSGKSSLQAAQASALAQVGLLRYSGRSGYITVVDRNSVVLNNPLSPKINGRNMSDFQDAKGGYLYRDIAAAGASSAGHGYVSYWWPRPGAADPSPKLSFVQRYSPWGWDLVAGDYVDDIEKNFRDGLAKAAGLLLVLGVALFFVAAAVSRNIFRAIGGEPVLAASIAQRIADGDLSGSTEQHRSYAESSVLFAIEKMRLQLAAMVTRIQHSAQIISQSVSEIASGSLDLSGRTEQQASSLEETAASMEQLTATVKQNAENASQAHGLAGSASTAARLGGEVMDDVIATMGDIKNASQKIVAIIGAIDGIAFQTNILALNAAVEAARAGEQGRGFAVVASEVRVLAQRSAAAAKQIKGLIDASVSKVSHGSQLVERAGANIQDIVLQVQKVNDIVREISSASREQSLGIEQANQAILDMDRVTQQNSALVEESSATTQSLQGEAAGLLRLVETFRLNTDIRLYQAA